MKDLRIPSGWLRGGLVHLTKFDEFDEFDEFLCCKQSLAINKYKKRIRKQEITKEKE